MKTVKVDIVSRWDRKKILFSAEVDASVGDRFRIKAALEMAVRAEANLRGANLAGAYLRGVYLAGAYLRGVYLAGANLDGAYLDGAYLDGAYLDEAYLRGAYLRGANLRGAYLRGANLRGAYLRGANLRGAYLDDESKLIGERPIFMLGPIGSESRTFIAYITDKGLRLRAGCFFGTREEFESKLANTHGDNNHAAEYRAALALIDAHCELWGPVPGVEGGDDD